MKKTMKWAGAGVLLLCLVWGGIALGQSFTASAGQDYLPLATPTQPITQPSDEGTSLGLYLNPVEVELESSEDIPFVTMAPLHEIATPTPLPQADGGMDVLLDIARSLLVLNIYDKDGALLRSGTGVVVINNYTIAANHSLLEGAAAVEALSQEGYTYPVTKFIATDDQKQIALLEFQAPTDLAPLNLTSEAAVMAEDMVIMVGRASADTFAMGAGKVIEVTQQEGLSVIACRMDLPHRLSGGVLLNRSGKAIGLPFAYADGGSKWYALKADAVVKLFSDYREESRQPVADVFAAASFETAAEAMPVHESSENPAVVAFRTMEPTYVQPASPEIELPIPTIAPGLVAEEPPYTYGVPEVNAAEDVRSMFPAAAQAILGVSAYGADGSLLAQSTGVVVFDNYTIAVSSNILENAIRLWATSDAGYAYQISKIVAVDEVTGIALLEFNSPTDIAPVMPGTTENMEGSLVDLISHDAYGQLIWQEGKVDRQADENVAYILECVLDADRTFIGGVLFNKLGEVIGIPYAYKREERRCYALDIGKLTRMYSNSREDSRLPIGMAGWNTPKPTAVPPNAIAVIAATTYVEGQATDAGITLSWEAVPEAKRYYVYRSLADGGRLEFVASTYEPFYMDSSAKAGATYSYTIKSVGAAALSEASEAVTLTMADTYVEPMYPLQFGGNAFLDSYKNSPSIDLLVENPSRTKTVTGFSVIVYPWADYGTFISNDEGNSLYTVFDIKADVAPLGSTYTGPLYLGDFSYPGIKYINAAILSVTTEDGEVIQFNTDPSSFSCWETGE